MTSQPIRLSTNFMTLIPSLTFTDYEWFPWSICNGCGMPAGNAYPSGHLVPSPILGLANAPIVETKLAMSLLDFSPRIPLGTFSILLWTAYKKCLFYFIYTDKSEIVYRIYKWVQKIYYEAIAIHRLAKSRRYKNRYQSCNLFFLQITVFRSY